MTLTETMVRMGDYVVSASQEDVLVSIGLGSCIGLALIDSARGVAALAHVMLPASPASGKVDPGKYADTAVPAVLAEVLDLGARKARIDAVLVGGAQMFSFGGGSMDVGARNAAAVHAELDKARLPIRATATGGSTGRTIRVDVATGIVSVKSAGAPAIPLFSPSPGRR